MVELLSFDEYIDRLEEYCDSKYRLKHIKKDNFRGLLLTFRNGYEIQFDNCRLLNAYERVKSGDVDLERSYFNIGQVIDNGMKRFWFDMSDPKNSQKTKRHFYK